jgi:hypothetical protein
MVPMRLLMPPAADGNAFLAAFVANAALCGTFPLLDLLAICLVQTMVAFCYNDDGWKCCVFTCFSPSHGVFFSVLPVQVTVHAPLFLYF